MQLCGGVRMFWIADKSFGLRLLSLVCGSLFAETLIKTEAKHVRDMPHPPISGRSDFNSPAALTAKDTVLSSNILEAVMLKKRQESAIVSKHNDLRNQVQPTAKKMRKITWNKELSDVATNYSRKCIYEHNKDRRHSRFGQIGENIYIVRNMIWSERLAERAITVWDLEKNDYDYGTRKCTPGKKCGHYTQTAWDDTFKVGCGATRCRSVAVGGDLWKDAVLFVCNYGPTGNYDRRPFIAGQSCSDCDEGDVCEGKLCSNQIRDIDFDGKLQWSVWSEWSACSAACGDGKRTRTRSCQFGRSCAGYYSEEKQCDGNCVKPAAGYSTNPTKQAAGSRGNFLKPSISLTSAVAAAMMIFYDFI